MPPKATRVTRAGRTVKAPKRLVVHADSDAPYYDEEEQDVDYLDPEDEDGMDDPRGDPDYAPRPGDDDSEDIDSQSDDASGDESEYSDEDEDPEGDQEILDYYKSRPEPVSDSEDYSDEAGMDEAEDGDEGSLRNGRPSNPLPATRRPPGRQGRLR